MVSFKEYCNESILSHKSDYNIVAKDVILILRKSKDLDKQDVLKSLSNINLSNYL